MVCRKLDESKKRYECTIKKLREELNKERSKTVVADSEAALSFGAKKQTEICNHLEETRDEVTCLRMKLRQLESTNRQLEEDLGSTCQALKVSRDETKELLRVENVVERKKLDELNKKLLKGSEKEVSLTAMCSDFEHQVSSLTERLRKAEERNGRYEEKHNLVDAVKHQKKLEADIFRRDCDIKQLVDTLGRKDDRLKLLEKAFNVLQVESNINVSDLIVEKGLESLVKIDEDGIRSQNNELIKQINMLESDRNNLMRRLRENAIQISEKGIRFHGLTSQQMEQISEFAKNLKLGRVELPLNDRSAELNAQLESISAERKADLITIDRLKEECERLRFYSQSNGSIMDSELCEVKNTLKNIEEQNRQLREDQDKYLKNENKNKNITVKRDIVSAEIKEKVHSLLGEELETLPERGQCQVIQLVEKYTAIEKELSTIKESRKSQVDTYNSAIENLMQMKRHEGQEKVSIGIQSQMSNPWPRPEKSKSLEKEFVNNGQQCSLLNMLDVGNTAKRKINFGQQCSFVKASKGCDVKVQVNLDVNRVNDLMRELEITKDALISSKQLQKENDSKISKLQQSIMDTASSTNNKNKHQIALAQATVKQLQLIIEKKNEIIHNYRQKGLLHVSRRSDSIIHDGDLVEEKEERMVVKESNDSIQVLMNQLSDASLQLKGKDSTISKMEAMIKTSERATEEHLSDLGNALEEIRTLKQEHMLKVKHLMEGRKRLTELLSEKEEGERKAQHLTYQHKQLLEMNESLRQMLFQKEETIQRLRGSFASNQKAMNVNKEKEETITSLRIELDRTKTVLNVAKKSKDRCQKALSLVRKSEEDLKEQCQKLKNENATLRKKVLEAKQEKHAAAKKCISVTERIRALQKEQKCQDERDTIKLKSQEDRNTRLSTLEKENKKLRGTIAILTKRPSGPKRRQHKGCQTDRQDDLKKKDEKDVNSHTGIESNESDSSASNTNFTNQPDRTMISSGSLQSLHETRQSLLVAQEENLRWSRRYKFEIPLQIKKLQQELDEVCHISKPHFWPYLESNLSSIRITFPTLLLTDTYYQEASNASNERIGKLPRTKWIHRGNLSMEKFAIRSRRRTSTTSQIRSILS